MAMMAEGDGMAPRPDLEMLGAWTGLALEWASGILEGNPPNAGDRQARAEALVAIDDVLHIRMASELETVRRFYSARMSKAVEEIESTRVSGGAVLWKMYNHGFVLRTRAGTVAFDLIRGYGGTSMDGMLAARLARQIDLATVSHWHPDHADLELCRLISRSGGRILVPPDLHKRWSTEEGLDLVCLGAGERYDQGALHLTALKGHHDGPPDNCDCNIHHLRVEEGPSAMHTGDHWINRRMPLLPAEEEVLNEWGKRFPVDLLLVNRSPYHFANIVGRIGPRMAVSSHENELSHDIASRATYAESISQMESIERPCYTMAWGEKLVVHPR